MPFDVDDVLVIAPCERDADGNWIHPSVIIHVRATELHRLGIRPDELTSPIEPSY